MDNQPLSLLRLPQEPYPGLRPFLDHEACLLFGRAEQITQIVDRLRETHFVAVIGGSGSGKSSLIRAGVVPRLRAFGISEAGDYWVPVIYTPGTSKPNDTHTPQRHQQTPVTRLAWKFARTLAPQNNDTETQALCDEIATVFRQGAGFTRLIRSYYELLPSSGPKSENARFLFVLDQFEELFHPNNRASEDARLIIEAVIDHFADPDPRCFLVMTMRSEHLADCAAYLQLPDAINRSFYLVRRLKRHELRDVIMGPAHVFLRLQKRADYTRQQDIEFAPQVIHRLIADVEAIEDDPDHLPLLQHLLARLWQTAKNREGLHSPQDIPSRITWEDLAQATDPTGKKGAAWWHDNGDASTLRDCLENWAQHTYQQRSPDDRHRLDSVLRCLAFKDPNNGQYFQERVDVDDKGLWEGISTPKEELWRLLEHGFIDSVNYMFWDDENPALTTLKVSHESFIRGWPHFRQLVDAEAERFDEFVTILRRCLDWLASAHRKSLLLETADLERLAVRNLLSVFHDPATLESWFNVLRQSRDGERLAITKPDVSQFVRTSQERQDALERARREREERVKEAEEFRRQTAEEEKERQRQADMERLAREAQARQDEADSALKDAELARARESVKWARLLKASLLGAAVYVAFMFMVKDPAFNSITLFSQAQTKTENRTRSNGSPDATHAYAELDALLIAADNIQKARSAFPIAFDSPSDRAQSGLLPRIGHWIGPALPTSEFERLVKSASTERTSNTILRSLLTTVVWSSRIQPKATQQPASKGNDACMVVPEAAPTQQSLEKFGFASGPSQTSQRGSSVTRPEQGTIVGTPTETKALFIPNRTREGEPIRLLQVRWVNGKCEAMRTVAEFPSSPWPMAILIDDRVSRLALAQLSPDAKPTTTFFSIEWQWDNSSSSSLLQINPIRQVNEYESALMPFAEMRLEDRPANPLTPAVKVLMTRQTRGGYEIEVAGHVWRILSGKALPISEQGWDKNWSLLSAPTEDSICDGIGQKTKDWIAESSPGMRISTLTSPNLGVCVTIARFDEVAGDSKSATPRPLIPVNVSVYDVPLSDEPIKRKPSDQDHGSSTASAEFLFDTQAPGQSNQWWVGKPGGNYEGWLATSPSGEGKSPKSARATPFSTAALLRLGCETWQLADPKFIPKDLESNKICAKQIPARAP